MRGATCGVASLLLATTGLILASTNIAAQVEAELPTVRGVVVLGDQALPSQPVALHRVSPEAAGEIANSETDEEGAFSFELPAVPGGTDEVYFVATRHEGILYFGAAVTDVASLDSIHTLVVYDTTAAPQGGYGFTVSARNVFVEEVENGWQITDVFELQNGGARTVISAADGVTWSYPLMTGATDVELGDGDLGPDVFSFTAGRVYTSAPVPPGSRLYVFRYTVPELVRLPMPGTTTRVELLIREPAPPLTITTLRAEQPVEIEPGSTFRHYVGEDLVEAAVGFTLGDEGSGVSHPVLAVLLALGLGLIGVWAATRKRPDTVPATRAAVLLEIARLDEEFEAEDTPGSKARRQYEVRRSKLLQALKDRQANEPS